MTSPLDDPRWSALASRDALADGSFVYAVATTGIYCAPSCGARTPLPRHVTFYDTPREARAAGFRPCRRCLPDLPPRAQREAALLEDLCRFIEAQDAPPSLQTLAERAALSPAHLHRLFKARLGLTPRAYADACRAERVRQAVHTAPSITDALYDAGYGSSSRLYEQSGDIFGMNPTQFKNKGQGVTLRFAVTTCDLGALLVAASPRGLCAVALGDDPEDLQRQLQARFPQAVLLGDDPGFAQTVAEVVACVEQPARACDLPLDIQGTAFQRRVWEALRAIPPGQTLTYAQLAQRLDAPTATRAVAAACAANTLAVLIPCHRVIRSDGSLAGYRWGVSRKRDLLQREASSPE